MKYVKKFNQINESVNDEYKALMDEISKKTKPFYDKEQAAYKEASLNRKKIEEIEKSYNSKIEALRKKAVEQEPDTATFISKHDRMRFNPETVKKSAEKTKEIIQKIIKANKKLDDDDTYNAIKKYADGVEIMIDDTNKIYKAVEDAGLYIHGM